MKKTMIILSAFLALVACNKEIPQNEGVIDPSKVVFNFTIQKADDAATKGVKTGWESGDVVYVFFEDNFTQYVKMIYNGSSWTYKDNVNGTEFSGLTLTESGKKLSAVYMPGFVIGTSTIEYVTDKWTIGTKLGGYILKAESIDYTVTVVSEVTTVNAAFSMTAPDNMVQIYINESAPAAGNEYVLNMTNVKPFTFDGIVPGGAASITAGQAKFPLPAYNGSMDGDTGYYFWGILDNASAGAIDYSFQLVEQNAEKQYAISSKSKTVTTTISGFKAIKLGGLIDNARFVSLGYDGGPLWATGNLNNDGSIANPLEAGDYYKWCYLTPYDVTGITDPYNAYYNGEYDTELDPAYVKSSGAWRMPTKAEFEALYDVSNTMQTWEINWTILGDEYSPKGGYLVTSNTNGISLFFAGPGVYIKSSSLWGEGYGAMYWTSTKNGYDSAWYLYMDYSGEFKMYFDGDRYNGDSVRPVSDFVSSNPVFGAQGLGDDSDGGEHEL